MTRIKLEPSVLQVGTSDLQNAENVRSNLVAGNGSENAPANVKVPVSAEALASKLSEGDLQAKARAAELNSLLNTQKADQPKSKNSTGLYDLIISSFKDPEPRMAEDQANSGKLQPNVIADSIATDNSSEVDNT